MPPGRTLYSRERPPAFTSGRRLGAHVAPWRPLLYSTGVCSHGAEA